MILCVIQSPGKGLQGDVIESKLKSSPGWANFGRGTWLIVTERSPAQWRDDLQPYVGEGAVLVMRIAKDWAGFTNEFTEWLHKNEGAF